MLLVSIAKPLSTAGQQFLLFCEKDSLLLYDGIMSLPDDYTSLLHECFEEWKNDVPAGRDRLLGHCAKRFEHLAGTMLRSFPKVKRWEQTGDVLQNAMIRLLKSLQSVRPESLQHFLSLAALQIRRELLDLARRYTGPQSPMAHHQSVAGSNPHDSQDAQLHPSDETHEPSQLAEWCELHTQMEQLPEEERQVFELVWYQGLGQQEAADLLGCSLRTLKRRWQSARLRLFDLLGGELPTGD